MKIAQLFGVKTNPSQQPRCCHKRSDGTECKAHPRKGRQYCFLHDPESQKKSAAARRAGGVLRRRDAQATPQAIPELACLLAKPMREASGVAEFLNEVARQFCQGNIDLRAAAEMRQCALAVLRTFEFEARSQREATGKAARPAKKQPFEGVNFVIRDINGAQIYPRETTGTSVPKPFSPPNQPDPKPDTAKLDRRQDKPDQDKQPSLSPASVASAQNQTEAQQPAKAEQQNETQPNGQHEGSQRYERILHGHSPFPPFIAPNQPEKAPENSSQQNGPSPGPRYIRTF
ncbi:MAG TPA: hypothetical protein VK738_20220 [Terriglobales bacterium]|jgi:hypothetical protein|nr:hypothetical protein [Terriglobales bacterium]